MNAILCGDGLPVSCRHLLYHDRGTALAPSSTVVPVTVAHDYFTQRGGAERVAVALIDAMRPTRVVTALHEPAKTFPIPSREPVETTFLQWVSAFRRDPRRALLVLPAAWRSISPIREGVVICSSSGWSHLIRVKGVAVKIVYCHNPPRWLYQPDDYFMGQRKLVKLLARTLSPMLRRLDKSAAGTANLYIANSSAVANRVRSIYGREAIVLHPPISLDPMGPQVPFEGVPPGYFITVGRGRGYKNVDLLVRAFRLLPSERLVVVGGMPSRSSVPFNVTFTSDVTDAQLRWLYANARALMSVSHEDFGLTPLEANALGTPALVLQAGGFLDSLNEGVSGVFIADAEPETIARAVDDFPDEWDRSAIRHHADSFSIESFTLRLKMLVASTLASVQNGDGARG